MNIRDRTYVSKIGAIIFGILMLVFFGKPAFASSPDIPVATNIVPVSTWAEFETALGNPDVDQIDIMADLTANRTYTAAGRTVTINGGSGANKRTINMGAYSINLGAPDGLNMLSINNIAFVGSSSTTPVITHTAATGSNWILNIKKSTINAANNQKRLATLNYGTIYFSDGVDFYNGTTNPMIQAKNVYIEDDFKYVAGNGPAYLASNFNTSTQPNGVFNISNSTVNLTTAGDLFGNSATASTMTTMKVTDSKLNIINARSLYLGNSPTDVEFENTETSVGTVTGNLISTNTVGARIVGTFTNSPFSGTTTASIIRSGAATSPVEVAFKDSPITITNLGGVAQAANTAAITIADFTHSNVTTNVLNGPIVSGGIVNSNWDESDIKIANNLTQSVFSVLGTGTSLSKINFNRTDFYARQTTKDLIPLFSLIGSTNVILDKSLFDIDIAGRAFNYGSSSNGSQLRIINDTSFTMKNSMSTMITASATGAFAGVGFLLEVDGENTRVNLTSESTLTSNGNSNGAVIDINSPNARIKLGNKAQVYIKSTKNKSPVQIRLYSRSGEIDLSGQSKLVMTKTDGSDDISGNLIIGHPNATATEGTKLNLREGSLLKLDSATISPSVRMQGGPSHFKISEASRLEIRNRGQSTAQFGYNPAYSITSSTEAGDVIHTFEIEDENSSMEVVADNGQAFFGSQVRNTLRFITGDNTYVVMRGKPYDINALISSYRTQISLGKMKYFDFWNVNTDKPTTGKLFLSYAQLTNINFRDNHLAVWLKPTLSVNPTASFANASLSANGIYFGNIDSATPSLAKFISANPIQNWGRINGNNQRAQINDIRVPTNADKHIWLHASVPEGISDGNRDAFTDEVTVKVAVRNADGSLDFEAEGKSIGDNVSVYGEDKRGMVKIDIPEGEFIESGQKVQVINAWRGAETVDSPDAIVSLPTDIAKEVTAIDVTPPNKVMNTYQIDNSTKQLSGESDENGAKVFVKVNGEWLKNASNTIVSTVVSNNQWTINLPDYLTKDDVVDIYMKDTTEITGDIDFDLPASYTTVPDGDYGNININPTGYDSFSGYHDAIDNTGTGGTDERFDSAVRKTTADVLPDNPTLVKTVTSSGGSVTGIGDELTYTLVAKNNKKDVKDWRNVEISDVLDKNLVEFNPNDHGININGVEAAAGDFTFDTDTGRLVIKAGDISATEAVTVTFKVNVLKGALNKEIKNRATASGDSPQETPFVPGPINPNANHVEISIESNEVGVPGNIVMGVLRLVSAPKTINFGKVSYDATVKRVDNGIYDQDLIVNDTREKKSKWTLGAKLISQMTNTDDESIKLVDSLQYVNGDKTVILSEDLQGVYQSADTPAEDETVINISDTWGSTKDSNGIKLVIDPTKSKITNGQYTGEIEWQLMEATP